MLDELAPGVEVVDVGKVPRGPGARQEESGMLSGLNTTGHEVGGALGVAVLVTIASAAGGSGPGQVSAAGIGHALGRYYHP